MRKAATNEWHLPICHGAQSGVIKECFNAWAQRLAQCRNASLIFITHHKFCTLTFSYFLIAFLKGVLSFFVHASSFSQYAWELIRVCDTFVWQKETVKCTMPDVFWRNREGSLQSEEKKEEGSVLLETCLLKWSAQWALHCNVPLSCQICCRFWFFLDIHPPGVLE